MNSDDYTFGQLIEDLNLDLASYSKNCLKIERVSCWVKIRIAFTYPTFWLIAFYRYEFWINAGFKNTPIEFFLKLFGYLGKRIFEITTKSKILERTKIDPGFCLAGKSGMMIGANKIGRECTIFENVTLGMDVSKNLPEIGDFVEIGSESIVYGGVKIGNGVIIKPSTILSKSVPEHCIVEGNPGRIIKKDRNNSTT